MKIRSLLICFLLLPALLFAQASSESAMDNSDYYTATDANNRTLKLAQKPSHILIAGKAGNMPANALFLFEEVESMDHTLHKTDQGLGDFFAFIRPGLD
ncbi:MAG TPA: ABC transporter substrate-binding protein, partial [Sphaerochaeta sp.]|nr:ABC transporter substrate-binding protein [Sphaerochaeta sp.]